MKLPEFWKTYLILLIGAGAFSYAFFVERKKPEGGESKPKEKVFTIDKAKVGELTIAPDEGETIKLAREGTGWKMTAPSSVLADTPTVDSILSSLESFEVEDVVAENATNLADYGLDKPKLTLEVVSQGAPQPLKVLLGSKVPDGSATYAKLPSSNRVFTVPSYASGAFEKKPFDLRDRDLLHVKREDVKTLDINGPEGSYALARAGNDEWNFTRPVATRAARWSIDSLLGNLESLHMESVAAEEAKDPKAFGLAKPARTVTLGLADGSMKTLEIGSAAGDKKYNVRVAGSPLVAVVPATLVEDLSKGMAELRAKRLLEVATYEVQGLDVTANGATATFAKNTTKDREGTEKSQWKRTAPEAKDVDTNKVEDALFKLGGVEVAQFIDKPADASTYGLDAPVFKLTIRMGEKGQALLELGKKDGVYFARRAGDTSILKLETAKAEELTKAFAEL